MRTLLALLVTASLSVLGIAAVAGGPGSQPYASAPSALAGAEIPPELLARYQAAAATCAGLPWQVLAAVGWVESRHGGGRADHTTGDVVPPIVGPALDGRPGRARITDASEPDGWAHAHGPMQFLATTWATWATLGVGRPPGAEPDPDNAWDAIATAASYLCGGEAAIADLASALLRYNHSQDYVEAVFAKAGEYGLFATVAVVPGTNAVGGALVAGSPAAVVAAAVSALGVPYVWGGGDPSVGLDCSGLVRWAYAQAGVAVPRTTRGQIGVGIGVGLSELALGDLVFSRGGRSGAVRDFGHVAIYIGGGQVVVAPHSGAAVRIQPLIPDKVQAVRRVLAG